MRSKRDRRRSLGIQAFAAAVITLFLASGAPRAANPPDFLVVVNAANPVKSLTGEELSRLFLKKVTTWADGQTVLPVDQSEDSSVRVAFTRDVLRRKVAAVKACRQAIQALETGTFDLVLMDVHMPVLDGFETTAEIRSNERATGGHIPILALTALAMKGDTERCIEVGMDHYLSKPFTPSELRVAIEAALSAAAGSRAEAA